MKFLSLIFLCLAAAVLSPALTNTGTSYVTRTVSVSSPNYRFDFEIDWSCDDYPASSAPGKIELRDGSDNVVARLSASVYRGTGTPSYTLSAGSSVADDSFWMARYATDGAPADGSVQGTWTVTGLAPGDYTLRLYRYTTNQVGRNATTVWTNSSVSAWYPAPGPNGAPSIEWVSAPASAEHGQSYTINARGHDADGNLAQVSVWKNGQPFAFAGGGNGTDGDSGNPTSDSGPQTVTFTAQAVDASGAASPVISHAVVINPPGNSPPSVTLLSPGEQTVTAGTMLTLSARATDPDGNISGHNLDIQRPGGDWNFQGGFATGEPYQGGPVGNGADSTRAASFTFTDVGTYYVRSGVSDGSGWYHSATVAITVVAPPPAQYTLSIFAGSGGTVSGGGMFTAGSTPVIAATADALHDFVGWSGDASVSANPQSVLMDRNKAVQATFALKSFTLTTSAASGGGVTPGGAYPYGSTVTIAASADAAHYFTGWSGDAASSAPSVAVLIDRAKFVQAQFAPKAAQTIAFSAPGNQNAGAMVPLVAVSSSGLPVSFLVLSGPAVLDNGTLTVTGPGSITVQAIQAGDAYTLPAAPVNATFNAAAPVVVKYQSVARTSLRDPRTVEAANYVLGNP